MKQAHTFFLNDFADAHTAEFAGKESDHFGRRLLRVKMKNTSFTVTGDSEMLLPAGTERVAPFCRYFELHGEDLHLLGGIRLLPVAPNADLPVSTKTPTVYRVKVPALPAPSADAPGFRLRLTGNARIHEIHMVPFNQLMETFDDIPYRNLGHELPPQKAKVTIDTTRELSIAGHIQLDRSKWFRYYGKPGTLPKVLEDHAAERGFLPGRQMIKFEPAFVKGYNPKDPKLTEDHNRPGHADPEFFASKYRNTHFANAAKWYPKDTTFAMCINDYPDFMSREHTGRGTPLTNRFPAAAELVADFLKNQIKHSGRTATWWELKNEATIKAEWDYHFRKGYDSWALMAEFHNTVADRVHQEVPGVKIGGPASAWMQVQVKDFLVWDNLVKFMDLTKGHMDFYSHHFYEDMGTIGAHARRDRGYRNYLLGRMEAILDMFQSHMDGTDNVQPILLTELGSLNIGNSEADYWLRLRTYSAMLTRLFDRPHQIDLAVPFIFLACPWDPGNGHAVFIPNDGKRYRNDLATYERTKCGWFLDLWRDFKGRRLPVSLDRRYLKAVAVHEGNVIRIALSNMSGRRQSVDLSPLTGQATQRRLYRVDGRIIYEDASDVSLKATPVEVEETTIVTIRLDQAVKPMVTILREDHFAPNTATRIKEQPDSGFRITVNEPANTTSATLVVGLQRSGGLTENVTASVNGQDFIIDTNWAKGVTEVFEQAEIHIPAKLIRRSNQVRFASADQNLTITSLHLRLEEPSH